MKKKTTIKPSRFHLLEPDYQRAPYHFPDKVKKHILNYLRELYGNSAAKSNFDELERVIQVYYAHKSQKMLDWEKSFSAAERFSEEDVILITYGDLIRDDYQPPLHILAELCKKYLKGVFNTLHILPFFPSSSDRGFSVTDFTEVDPDLGGWEDLMMLKDDFRLMFDGVFNHISSKSKWFQEFLNQNPRYINFFTVFSTSEKIPSDYLQLLVRPRTSDVLTPFDTLMGKKFVWTTFSPDQIDLNFSNPEVLIKMIDILLFYVRKGADLIRLDAVTYLWDELGTTGAHLKQTHVIIKLFRLILDVIAPHVALITETNVPHEDNITYFGNGYDEAQMVYNFALPPLVLHTFQTGDASKLSHWTANLPDISDSATFFNFLDSHDGVGVMAAKNILTAEEIERMALKVIENGGFISYKTDKGGSVSPYELNITWYSALNKEDKRETVELQVKRYLASRAIALVIKGVPGIYLHGLLGSKNDAEAVIEEEQTRSINRKNLNKAELIRALLNPETTTYKVSYKLATLIMKRTHQKAFSPNSDQKIVNVSEAFFTVLRCPDDKSECILAITNITSKEQLFSFDLNRLAIANKKWRDVITGKNFTNVKDTLSFTVEPYGLLWLKPVK
jgi:sucrose phosphorylase